MSLLFLLSGAKARCQCCDQYLLILISRQVLVLIQDKQGNRFQIRTTISFLSFSTLLRLFHLEVSATSCSGCSVDLPSPTLTLCCPLLSSPLRCSSVLQHEPPGAAAPEPAGRRLAAVPPTLVRHWPAQRGPQPEPAQRRAALCPEPRYADGAL